MKVICVPVTSLIRITIVSAIAAPVVSLTVPEMVKVVGACAAARWCPRLVMKHATAAIATNSFINCGGPEGLFILLISYCRLAELGLGLA